MPHIKEKFRVLIRKDLSFVSSVGDINFAYTDLVYIPMWKINQSYNNISIISEIGLGRFIPPEVLKLDTAFSRKGFSSSQIASAKLNSYLEFYRIVAVNYEDKARLENGCVYEDVPFASRIVKIAEDEGPELPEVPTPAPISTLVPGNTVTRVVPKKESKSYESAVSSLVPKSKNRGRKKLNGK